MTDQLRVPALLEDAQVKAALDRFGDDWRTDDEKRSASAPVTALLRALGTGEGPVPQYDAEGRLLLADTAPLRARIARLEAELFAETQGRELLADCEARLKVAEARVRELEKERDERIASRKRMHHTNCDVCAEDGCDFCNTCPEAP